MRLDKFISDCVKDSRSEIKASIRKGEVFLGNTCIKDPAFQVVKEDTVLYKGKTLSYTQFVYLMMNKPQGVISAVRDKKYKTVIDLVGEDYSFYDLFPVGRLDLDTEGLLILTNDGDFAHKALSPRYNIDKTYYVETLNPIPNEAKLLFSEGVYISGGHKTLPANLEILTEKSAYLTIHEGKFHQVKLMFEALKNQVTYLKRIKFGNLTLDEDLPLGSYRPILPEEKIF